MTSRFAGHLPALVLGGVLATACATTPGDPTPGAESEGVRDLFEHMNTEPYEFIVNSDQDVERASFDRRRAIRVCVDDAAHTVPLRIYYDGDRTRLVEPGRCARIETDSIAVSAADTLEDGWVLSGRFERAE